METFLRRLLRDLENRTTKLRDRVAAIDTDADPELNEHTLRAYQYLESTRRSVTLVLQEPALHDPRLIRNYVQLYRRWSQVAEMVESFILPFIERYSEQDRRLTYLCRTLANQVKWPLSVPLVCGFSTQYFWTKPEFNLIAVPTGEGESLLALPDLCHELGHILLEWHQAELVGDFLRELDKHFRAERRRPRGSRRSPEEKILLTRLQAVWSDAWIWEFASDMIATFLVGVSFGWQHLRLCMNAGQSGYFPPFDYVSSHPANDARMQGILVTLSKLNLADGSEELERLWRQFISVNGENPPPEYAMFYPPNLIDSLATNVVQGCHTLGLRRYDPNDQPTDDIPSLVATAWRQFLVYPDTYGTWESQSIDTLWRYAK